MRVTVLTIGTRGDVQPYVALGRGLVDAGHQVTICTCQKFQSFIEGQGLEYGFVNNDLMEFMQTEDARLAMERTGTLWQSLRTGVKLFPKIRPMLNRQADDLWRASEASKPDLIVFHPKSLIAKDIAERLDAPCMLGFYLPLFTITGSEPAMGFPNLPLGAGYRRWTHRMIDRAAWWGVGSIVKQWRSANDLPPPRSKSALIDHNGRPIPAVYAFSPSVIPPPQDWPPHAQVAGYWFLNDARGATLGDELESFLNSGEPPIYFGFGSIFGRDPAKHVKTIVEACQRVKSRAVIARGWGGLDWSSVSLPDSILPIDHAPHEQLFPRVAAVVHHGGCGTTAAGLRAGKPSLLCPFFGDQPFWADRAARLGVGPAAIPQGRLNVANLEAALHSCLTDQTMQQRAEELGRKIRSEDGVGRGVEFVEKFMASR